MLAVGTSRKVIETNLFDGLRVASLLLRIGYYTEAASLCGQLLAHFPRALPLHVGLGRALFSQLVLGDSTERAIAHMRRVLEADPENWRIRLEIVMLYLQGEEEQQHRAGQELWLTAQTAPDNWLLRELIGALPEHPYFERTQRWLKTAGLVSTDGFAEPAKSTQDEGGTARQYLRRNLPGLAAQYFESTIAHLPRIAVSRADLKNGLLLSLWLDGQEQRASALASDMLLEQPQLLLPRLLLISFLGNGALKKNLDQLLHLTRPVWELDPLLERSFEISQAANFHLPDELFPRPQFIRGGEGPQVTSLNTVSLDRWQNLGYYRPLQIKLETVDWDWLEELLKATRKHETDATAQDSLLTPDFPYRELSFNLSELERIGSQPVEYANLERATTGATMKGYSRYPGGRHQLEDLDRIAASIRMVENILYGGYKTRTRSSRPATRRRPGGTRSRTTAKGPVAEKQRQQEHFTAPAINYSADAIFSTRLDDSNGGNLRQATALIVTSEANLTSKYGRGGYRQILPLLEQLVEVMKARELDARLLLVDSPDGLRQHGYSHLSPVPANQPTQIRSLINAALAGENTFGQPPTIVFIIGGPDIIPFWKLPNPTFDSDKDVLSDNPYGSRDSTYLLPERIVGRLPDDGGPKGDANLTFLLRRLQDALTRQKAELVRPKVIPPLPLRLVQSILPNGLRNNLNSLDGSDSFEQDWLRSNLGVGGPFLDGSRASQLPGFFYGAEAWKSSTETLRDFIGGKSSSIYSPPTQVATVDRGHLKSSRLLHFNLHGFRDTPNWYGQSQVSRIVTSPSISSLPLAFAPKIVNEIVIPPSIVFSEACYGGYLPGRSVAESTALSFLDKGATAFIGSSVISYGSAGPELSCASHLAYYFWRATLKQGFSYGQALKVAKTEYARERLAQGHNLTGDDVKTLLEFVLLGDPTIGIRAVSPSFVPPAVTLPLTTNAKGGRAEVMAKGGFGQFLQGFLPVTPEEEQRVRGLVRFVMDRINKPKAGYREVEYERLPVDLKNRIDSILAWLLPDPVPPEGDYLQALIQMGSDYNRPGAATRPNRPFPKGGDSPNGFADWLEEDEPAESNPGEVKADSRLLFAGSRSLQTNDGLHFSQSFHLNTDFAGTDIKLDLSRGNG